MFAIAQRLRADVSLTVAVAIASMPSPLLLTRSTPRVHGLVPATQPARSDRRKVGAQHANTFFAAPGQRANRTLRDTAQRRSRMLIIILLAGANEALLG
jgi:hypothetical protein